MDFINRLREKSPATKKVIAFTASAVVTLAIFGLWMTVFHFGLDSKPSENTAAVADSIGYNSNSNSGSDVNPFSAFWTVLSTGWSGLAENINQIKTGVGQAKNFVGEFASTTSQSTQQPTVKATPQVAPPDPQKDVFIISGN